MTEAETKILHAPETARGSVAAQIKRGVDEHRIVFSPEEQAHHRRFKTPTWHYLLHSRLFVLLSAPFIYLCVVPFLMLDLFITTYQAVCFPIYGIPKAHRANYLIFDRSKLRYLNGIERVNCRYCSYANGLLAYAVEIVARTEQHWCPIKHSRELLAPHSRYVHFVPYGDAPTYRAKIEEVRTGFKDVS